MAVTTAGDYLAAIDLAVEAAKDEMTAVKVIHLILLTAGEFGHFPDAAATEPVAILVDAMKEAGAKFEVPA